jgi:hypothetical protein
MELRPSLTSTDTADPETAAYREGVEPFTIITLQDNEILPALLIPIG